MVKRMAKSMRVKVQILVFLHLISFCGRFFSTATFGKAALLRGNVK